MRKEAPWRNIMYECGGLPIWDEILGVRSQLPASLLMMALIREFVGKYSSDRSRWWKHERETKLAWKMTQNEEFENWRWKSWKNWLKYVHTGQKEIMYRDNGIIIISFPDFRELSNGTMMEWVRGWFWYDTMLKL